MRRNEKLKSVYYGVNDKEISISEVNEAFASIMHGTPLDLDNIKAEISEKKANSGTIAHKVAYSNCLEIIDKHTSGGDTE